MELLRLTLMTCAYPQNGLSHLIFADCSCLASIVSRVSGDDVAALRLL